MQINEPAEYALLGLLKLHPMHGYEIFQYFENGTPGQIVHLEMSQMYAYLKKLERMTYIKAQLEQQGTRPPRKIFHLTEQGQTIFLQWLHQSVEKPRDIRIHFLIKLYFARLFVPHQIPDLLTQQIQACQHFLTLLEARTTAIPVYSLSKEANDSAFFDQVVLSSRIYQTHALLEWMLGLQQNLAEPDHYLSGY